MGWIKTHQPGGVGCKPMDLGAVFAQIGAIWECDECGMRWKVVRKGRGPEKGWARV